MANKMRGLQNVVMKTLAGCEGRKIRIMDIPLKVSGYTHMVETAKEMGYKAFREKHFNEFEKRYFEGLLRKTKGDVERVAQEAYISRAGVYEFLKKHSLEPREFRG